MSEARWLFFLGLFQWRLQGRGSAGRRPAPPSLRKHPFLLALRRCGRFAAMSEEKRMFSLARHPPPPPLFLDENEARRAEKKFFLRPAPTSLSQGLDDRPLPPPPPLSGGLDPLCFPFLNIQSPMLLTVIVNIY